MVRSQLHLLKTNALSRHLRTRRPSREAGSCMRRNAVIHDLQVLTQDGLSPGVSGKGAIVERVVSRLFPQPISVQLGKPLTSIPPDSAP